MSAAFKNAKKKFSQSEIRKFMSEHKSKTQKVAAKKIESPLAKYNEAGQLTCILCKSVVRSENVWSVHVNAKQHRENVEQARKLKDKLNNAAATGKRPPSPQPEEPNKKLKSILKNSATPPDTTDKAPTEDTFKPPKSHKGSQEPEKMDTDDNAESLPEGFFDDPKLDAKARNLEYKDPVEEEWERFQREIREVDSESAAIIAEDQEEATNERQLDEIDEQLKNWSRVVHLEKKKVEITSLVNENANSASDGEASDTEEDFEEYLDWRAKKSFR